MNLYIITGVSMGIGNKLFVKLSKKSHCIGTTTKQNVMNDNIFYYSFDNSTNNDENWQILAERLKKYKNKKIVIFLNAAIFDRKEDNFIDKQLILNVNFFNQIKFVHKIKNFLDPEKLKIIFFSSFTIYNDKSKLPYYKISKSLFNEEFFRVKDQDKNICYKLFILAGIKTESYLKNSKKKFFNKIIDVDIDHAVNFILKKISNDNNKIIYYPKIYILLQKLLFIKKIFS